MNEPVGVLGRLSYSDINKNGLVESNEILSEADYYPFGLQHTENSIATTANKAAEKYQYNAKEFQDELNLNVFDYGARNYDAAIGRWFNHDPLSEVTLDPYGYTYNNPMNLIDPTGMGPEDWFVNKYTGNVVKVQGVSDLSQLTDDQMNEYDLGQRNYYERLGKDDMFGKSVTWTEDGKNFINLYDSKFVMLNSDSREFMEYKGYEYAERVKVEENKNTSGGRMGAENVTHTNVSLKEISSTKTYAIPSKLDTRQNEKREDNSYRYSSTTKVNYDYIRRESYIKNAPKRIENSYFTENRPGDRSAVRNTMIRFAADIISSFF